ncbi:MAG: hypothetical protein LBG42_02340 [Treponema sp.]|nr:hypothetical protein [Treponema sp.]
MRRYGLAPEREETAREGRETAGEGPQTVGEWREAAPAGPESGAEGRETAVEEGEMSPEWGYAATGCAPLSTPLAAKLPGHRPAASGVQCPSRRSQSRWSRAR